MASTGRCPKNIQLLIINAQDDFRDQERVQLAVELADENMEAIQRLTEFQPGSVQAESVSPGQRFRFAIRLSLEPDLKAMLGRNTRFADQAGVGRLPVLLVYENRDAAIILKMLLP